MLELLQSFFAEGLFIPHGHCYLWKPGLLWLHIVSDILIAIAYYSIPITIVYFVSKRKDFPFKWLFLLFGSFIISCGTTHLVDIWTLWHPTYWLSGSLKAFTAFISIYTAIVLVPIIPQALALPSPAQLELANSQLKAEIVERKIAEQELAITQTQLIQSAKMSSLGQLVAGIAHEINNPVNFIYGNINVANEYTDNLFNFISLYYQYYPHPVPEIQAFSEEIDLVFIKEDLPKLLSSMKMGAARIRKVVLSLKNFSRLDEAEIKEVDIHEGIDSTIHILQNRLKSKAGNAKIQVIKQYGNLPKVECYPGELNQVFMNILDNAIDAIDEFSTINHQNTENYQGKITIFTETLDSNEVIISFIDNGNGMTEEVKQKMFDPFFTTKPIGANTGLGMSVTYQIINKHGGKLKCISAPLQGTELQIQIPMRLKLGNT